MDINAEIQYDWKFGWDTNAMSEPRPIVNRLLKAIIEGNIRQMEALFVQGASLEKIDKLTLQRALFHVLGNFDVVHCMVKHGFHGLFGFFQYFECYEPAGYSWKLLGRAWYLGAYNVMDLLAKAGFWDMYFCSAGKGYDGIELCFYKNDVQAIVILLENGYWRQSIEEYTLKYPNSKVTAFLDSHPCVHRKSISLDPEKFEVIKKPELEKPGFFNKSRIKKENEYKMMNYADRVNAQKEFIKAIGEERWMSERKQICEMNEAFNRMAKDFVENRSR